MDGHEKIANPILIKNGERALIAAAASKIVFAVTIFKI
jgi:hypothetical protein